ncbi:MAG: nitroreductase family protein [Thermofilaceae archaeon]|nr:nitroreductase family protein [Thermofilaceae archaeon]MCX8180129.1 nitroreductase family protein [Thermofilaceae archaeon]MDW8004215.1 nitroreductase family protein [Thermofilaceae archaeon]
MEFYELVRRRRSVRAYKLDPVEEEKLMRILEAGRLAPSAANKQPWHFIVVKDAKVKEQLRKAYDREWFVKAPVVIVVCADPSAAWRRRDGEEYWKVDAAIAMEHIILAAANEGLGTCWIGAFDEKVVKEVLSIPEHIRVVAMTPLGYAAEEKGPVTDRKPLEQIVHFDKW